MSTPDSTPGPPSAAALGKQAWHKAWTGALWVYKILIPISLFTFVLDTSQVLNRIEGVLGPVMGLIHLPAKAAMPLIAGLLTGIYGGIAALSALSFTIKETTLIAIFLLISHNILQESAIQGRAGMHPIKAAILRLGTSLVLVWLIGWLWQGGAEPAPYAALATADTTWLAAFLAWFRKTLMLCLQILGILIVIMSAVVWMKAHRWDERLAVRLKPLLRFMGLSERAGLLWLAAVLFGVTYGAAVIVEETRDGALSHLELERLHLSIGINHSLVEDPALFLPLGIHPFWLWVPRLIAAFAAVHLLRLYRALQRRSRPSS
jgi:hypothetical protein